MASKRAHSRHGTRAAFGHASLADDDDRQPAAQSRTGPRAVAEPGRVAEVSDRTTRALVDDLEQARARCPFCAGESDGRGGVRHERGCLTAASRRRNGLA